MNEQVRLLEQLQQQDARLQEIEALLVSLPHDLSQAKQALQRMQTQLTQEQTVLAETEQFQRKREEEQKSLAAQIVTSKSKLNQVRTLRESNAAQREVESARRSLEIRETELQELTRTLEAQRTRLAERQQTLERYTQELAEQEASTARQLADLQQQQQTEHAARRHLTQAVTPDWLRMYESVRKRRWPVLVPAKRATCAGCHMHIPPQVHNNLQRFGNIEQCAHCQRMLYLPTAD